MAQAWSNWSGGVKAQPDQMAAPRDEAELVALMKGAAGPVRPAGSGHSFTPVCATDGTLVSLDHLAGIVDHDPAAMTATIRAGTKIHTMGQPLYDRGLSLINQGDIDRQTLAGAVSTGTHGTGRGLGSLSSSVIGLRLVTAGGDVIDCNRHQYPEIFDAARVSLGALGILSEITLQCRPAYKLKEKLWVVDADEGLERLDEYFATYRHFEFWWYAYADKLICKALQETDEVIPEPTGATGAQAHSDALSREEELGAWFLEMLRWLPFLAPWANRHFTKLTAQALDAEPETPARWSHEAFPSQRNLRFNEMEYSVPAADGANCLREVVAAIRKAGVVVGMPLEFRLVGADDIWLSPFEGGDRVSISVHRYYRQSPKPLFDVAESVFSRFGARPHWGKLHGLTAKELRPLYPRWDAFQRVRRTLDPKGVLLNDHLRTVFEG